MLKDNKLLLLLNLESGKTGTDENVGKIIKAAANLSDHLNIYVSKAPGDITRYVMSESRHFDRIICCGGDGSINEAIKGMIEIPFSEQKPLAIVPTGTTCDYARTLGIPLQINKAISGLHDCHTFAIDIGMFNRSPFCYVASFGAFSGVAFQTPRRSKERLGHIAYLLQGLKELPSLTSYKLELEIDGISYSGQFIFGAITNSSSIGGIIKLDENDVQLDDGDFECILIHDPSIAFMRTAAMAKMLVPGLNVEGVLLLRGKNFHLKFAEEVSWTLDGEDGGKTREVHLQNLCQKVKLWLPSLKHLPKLGDN